MKLRFPLLACLFLCVGVLGGCGNSKQSVVSSHSSLSACLNQLETQLQQIDHQNDSAAEKADPGQSQIRTGNESVLLRGSSNKIVFLLHGFLASPFEVRPLGQALQAQGYTVVMPLISGMGRSVAVAAETSSDEWVQSTDAQLEASQACSDHVQVIGFSLGALLEVKVISIHPKVLAKIASMTFISPAFKMRENSFLSFASNVVGALDPTPGISFLSAAARKVGNHDLDIPEKYPEYYLDHVPLATVKNLMRLSAELDFSIFSGLSSPIKIIYSEDDHTIDGAASASLIAKYKNDVKIFSIPASRAVPHQVLLSGQATLIAQITEEVMENFR